jgi:Protein of unknown function (DUF3168)
VIEQLFAAVLQAQSDITAITGPRIYPLVLPTNPTLPAIDYSFVGGSSSPTLTTKGYKRYRVEINCWGDTYADAVTLRSAVKDNLDGYHDGNMSIQLISPRDFFEDLLLQYRAMAEFYILTNL